MPSTRVVVTGLGATSPVGGDVASTWQAMLSGTSGIRRLTDAWVDQLPVKIGGRVAVGHAVDELPGPHQDPCGGRSDLRAHGRGPGKEEPQED